MNTESMLPEIQSKPPRRAVKVRGVFERKPGQWWIRYVDAQGRLRREKAGTKSVALDLYRKRKTQALAGKKLPEKLRRRAVPFSELCDDAAAYIRSNYTRPNHDLGRLEAIRKQFGRHAANSVTTGAVRAFLAKGRDELGWSISSSNHYHNLISLAFRLGAENEKAERNPASAVQRKKEDNSRVRCLSSDEEKRLREVIRSNPAWHGHEPELTLALNTGLRLSSMYRDLVWENVDLEARVATIPQTKNGDPVHVPLNADAIRALMIFRSRGDGTGRVLRNGNGFPLQYNNFWFVPAIRAAGIQDYTWHDNRHTYASRLRQRGVPLGNIAELLGHRGLSMTRRYAHLSISNLHEAVAKIENRTDTITDTTPVTEETRLEYVQ